MNPVGLDPELVTGSGSFSGFPLEKGLGTLFLVCVAPGVASAAGDLTGVSDGGQLVSASCAVLNRYIVGCSSAPLFASSPA